MAGERKGNNSVRPEWQILQKWQKQVRIGATMHKASIDMSKGFDAILDTAEELVAIVRDRQQTPDAAVTALAMALGKIAAENDLSLDTTNELVRISYVEAGKRSGGQA